LVNESGGGIGTLLSCITLTHPSLREEQSELRKGEEEMGIGVRFGPSTQIAVSAFAAV